MGCFCKLSKTYFLYLQYNTKQIAENKFHLMKLFLGEIKTLINFPNPISFSLKSFSQNKI